MIVDFFVLGGLAVLCMGGRVNGQTRGSFDVDEPIQGLGGCTSGVDCQLNGVCDKSQCHCDQGWSGFWCEKLDLVPAKVNSGFRLETVSTWGGNIIKEGDTYHGFFSEMGGHCGLTSWITNSRVVRATSNSPGGRFERQQVALPIWAHNPQIVKANDTFLLFHIGSASNVPETTCPGLNGTSPCKDKQGGYGHGCDSMVAFVPNGDARGNKSSTSINHTTVKNYTFPISFSDNIEGPWELYHAPIDFNVGGNANPSPIVLENGTVIMVFNANNMSLAVADSWKGPYKLRSTGACANGEDPFLYVDKRGNFHCLSHAAPFKDAFHSIAHSFSSDGLHWTKTEKAVAGAVVEFEGNRTVVFSKRERPKLIFDENKEITHLITGVAMTGQCTPKFLYPVQGYEHLNGYCTLHIPLQYTLSDKNPFPGHMDRSFTLIQAVRWKKNPCSSSV
mmetsp:Transcript_11994/g.19060  ORF Transcript_11994/g.19060 Transcript_11994/m.19060 type:complete len:447 (+) Transcript_11994:173-1513(+)